MASLHGSGGADTPGRPGREFRARSRKRRKPSSAPSPSTFATSSEPRVFAIDKPAGRTSHDVVAAVRRVLRGVKVGHAGTLDPDATGVLVLCVGKATKISSFLMEGEKEYVGRARLGVTTDTQDASGKVLRERPVEVGESEIRTAAARFVGRIEQVPPMFSAVKVSGEKLYRLARAGVEVDRPSRPVEVHELEIHEIEPPSFRFRLRCSKGTYVRTLVHDLGEALGCGGHLRELVRTRQAGFALDECLAFDELSGSDAAEAIRRRSVRPEEALAFLPTHDVPASVTELRVGALLDGASGSGFVRLVRSGGRVAGVGRVQEDRVRVLYRFLAATSWGRRVRAS